MQNITPYFNCLLYALRILILENGTEINDIETDFNDPEMPLNHGKSAIK